MITFSFLPVYFHFPQRVSSITICPAFLLIPFTFLPSLDHLTHYSLCQQVDYCLYCRAPFNRASGHCPQSWEWEADASAEESGRKDLSLGGMQMHSPPTDLHLTFIIPRWRNFHRECSWQPKRQHPTRISFLKIHSLSLRGEEKCNSTISSGLPKGWLRPGAIHHHPCIQVFSSSLTELFLFISWTLWEEPDASQP